MDESPVRTQDDLCRLWQSHLDDHHSEGRSLWLTFLDVEDRPTPFLAQVDGLPEQPEPVMLGNLMEICARIVTDNHGGRIALLLVRPGPHQRPGDRAWAAAILAAARGAGVPCAPVHLATDDAVRLVAADDLLPETG